MTSESGTVQAMKKLQKRQAGRRKPLKSFRKKTPKASKKAKFDPPERVYEESEREPVFVVGAMIDHIFVNVQIKDRVDVVAVSLESEVLDASGNPRVDTYRFQVPSDNDVVAAFFNHKKITETGEYRNATFQPTLVVEGMTWGEDSNPNDLSKPIKVLRAAKLLYLAEAMSELADEGEGVMADTGDMEKLRTKVDLPSQLYEGRTHPAGSLAVKVDTTAADGSMLLIEVQAKGWQECIEVPADQVEPWSDA